MFRLKWQNISGVVLITSWRGEHNSTKLSKHVCLKQSYMHLVDVPFAWSEQTSGLCCSQLRQGCVYTRQPRRYLYTWILTRWVEWQIAISSELLWSCRFAQPTASLQCTCIYRHRNLQFTSTSTHIVISCNYAKI